MNESCKQGDREQPRPAVLCISGLDPSGGAGIQADIETLSALGCHACPVITSLTVQDTANVSEAKAVNAALIRAQIQSILNDIPIQYMKIGLIGNAAIIEVVGEIIQANPEIKVILDPIISAGGGKLLTDAQQQKILIDVLFPHAFLITPNRDEAQRITDGTESLIDCASSLYAKGCKQVLITDCEPTASEITHQLWEGDQMRFSLKCERLPHTYHGSGCTLTTAITACLARGFPLVHSLQQAQAFTWQSLYHAHPLGKGQLLPNRFYWKQQPIELSL